MKTRASVRHSNPQLTAVGGGGLHDEFLSDEDLALRELSDEELILYWNQWLEQAQSTNALDADEYAHGVFAGLRRPELRLV